MRSPVCAILFFTTTAALCAAQGTATRPATLPAVVPNPLQLALRATREEWKVISPLVDDLDRARMVIETAAVRDRVADPLAFFGNDAFVGPSGTARGSLGFVEGFSGWGVTTSTAPAPTTKPVLEPEAATRPGLGADTPTTLAMAMADLQAAAADEKTPESALRDKLALVRAARARAESRLAGANEKLRRVLTIDQEALLVAMGVLD